MSENEKKLGQEPALSGTYRNNDGTIDYTPGMSKRFYAACAAMSIDEQYLDLSFRDEDMEKNDTGRYQKIDGYYNVPRFDLGEKYQSDIRYTVKTSYQQRRIRAIYAYVDELLKQENQ